MCRYKLWEWLASFLPSMHSCFPPPDGTRLLLNINVSSLQSDTHHHSQTSSVPHPKSCWGNILQEEKKHARIMFDSKIEIRLKFEIISSQMLL